MLFLNHPKSETSAYRYEKTTVKVLSLLMCVVFVVGCTKPKDDPNSVAMLPVIKPAPEFSGENSEGKNFTSTSLKGKIWLASFMFTNCGGVCPVMNGRQETLQSEYAKKGVHFVSITVDPENDSREVLAEYAKQYHADLNFWSFIRMEKDKMRKLAVEGFLVSDPIQPSDHSPRFILVDKKFNIRGYYDSMDSVKVELLKQDINKLLSSN
jgi:cytochrome oxidase Cu insertion factor (SCO1/SenC/PrrC family)